MNPEEKLIEQIERALEAAWSRVGHASDWNDAAHTCLLLIRRYRLEHPGGERPR